MLELGKLTSLPVRQAWKDEARDFTPWLAKPENLQLLSKALHIELELEAQEKSVGPFKADILCKSVGTDDHWVLIENQLERTDHKHLGQLLTYASGLDAVTIVWIADKFTEEHRSTLDWLNRITGEDFRFFGLEVEVWKIGDSSAAPKFNVVSKPNNWSKAVAAAARNIESGDLTETKLFQIKYWERFHEVLNNLKGSISGNRKAQPQSWMSYSIGKTGVGSNVAMRISDNLLRVELYLGGTKAKERFFTLTENRDKVEHQLGYNLIWDELPSGLDSRIYIEKKFTDITKSDNWKQQHVWLGETLNEVHDVFRPYVSSLP